GNRGDRPLSDRLNRARKKAEDADRINKLEREEAMKKAMEDARRHEEAMKKTMEDARRHAAAAEAAKKRAAAAADAAKWKCFGSANRYKEGFVLCSVECRKYYDYNFCNAQCHSGGKSARYGQSCFKEP